MLLVEDNVDSAEALALLLQLGDHQVVAVHDGASALEAAAPFAPQVVLCDIGLPGMDGYEVGAMLRGLLTEPPAVLVALTGYGDAGSRARSREAGFDHHLVKPLRPDELFALLAAVAAGEATPGR